MKYLIFICMMSFSTNLSADLINDLKGSIGNRSEDKITSFELTELGEGRYAIADLSEPNGIVGIYMSCKPTINRTTEESIALEYGFLTKSMFSLELPKYNGRNAFFLQSSSFNTDSYGERFSKFQPFDDSFSYVGYKFNVSASFFSDMEENYKFTLQSLAKVFSPPSKSLSNKKLNYAITITNGSSSVVNLKRQCASEGLAMANSKLDRIQREESAADKKIAELKKEHEKYDQLINKEMELAIKRREMDKLENTLPGKKQTLEDYQYRKSVNSSTNYYVEQGILVCKSPTYFDNQLMSIANGENIIQRGCFTTEYKEKVEILQHDPLFISQVRGRKSNDVYWILSIEIKE